VGDPDALTHSFIALQRLAAGFDLLRQGQPLRRGHERTQRRLATRLGATAVPLLIRQIASPIDAVSEWARDLLSCIAARNDLCSDRVVRELTARVRSDDLSAEARTRIGRLLAQLGASVATACQTADTNALRDHSLRELAGCLSSPGEVARAADLLAGQLDDNELLEFVDEFVSHEPGRGVGLVDELLVRDDVHERTRSELRRVRAQVQAPGPRPIEQAHPHRALVRLGSHRDGRELVFASVRRAGSRPIRHRVIWAILEADGTLGDVAYLAEVTGGAIDRNLLAGFRRRGFAIRRAPSRAGRGRVAAAARAALAKGRRLPRGFYLGRDILGIGSEHWLSQPVIDDDLAALLGRAIDLQSIGEFERARPLFERYVARRPDDPEGWANLGICLIETGDAAAAVTHLRRAVGLEPASALHHWNLAAAAHRAGSRASCYLALLDYLNRNDDDNDAPNRRQAARAYIKEYERLARLEHPERDPAGAARCRESERTG
jgi:tetratricopeptide (TPR) repeat protein